MDVPTETLQVVEGMLVDHRLVNDTRPWQRAASVRTQAIMILRWLTNATKITMIARDANVSVATGYRYLHEAIDVLAANAPDLIDVLTELSARGEPFVCLDGTLVPTTKCHAPGENTADLWFSGKHHTHGGNIQVLTDSTAHPVWTSPVEPGSTHDITAARTHCLGALYAAARNGMPTLADKGYIGAGMGIKVPFKGKNLSIDNQAHNQLINCLRAPAERANALLKNAFKILHHVTVCPRRIGHIMAAALFLLNTNGGRW